MKKGIFVSLEGIDGSGKTTLKKLIIENYNNYYQILPLREPGGNKVSEKIREMLLDVKNEGIQPQTEAMLYAAARAQLVEEIIKPAIKEGKLIIADRYMDSTIAYQGYGRNLDIDFLKQLNYLCTSGLKPDLTLLLDLEPTAAHNRRSDKLPDRLEKEGLSFQSKVRNGYLKIAKEEPQRVKLLDASQKIEIVLNKAIKLIDKEIKGKGSEVDV
ncbi:Thymidylate kinase [Candidatus Syntrophocurvum alkaliphilum]|uniref:Thymidylate kinase n=1 Tax=Candidatus Syntrophocurvum alkaliphilum TaxID=2293317 RepID=A0A6I6DI48_9FIRM|nr:dTMP kinase [Candidatus Syntrophocurvum alkaliphilum]QGU00584.1 Thymidylate kinase [Candidatus Syntrophocurvum alkaliphilum]